MDWWIHLIFALLTYGFGVVTGRIWEAHIARREPPELIDTTESERLCQRIEKATKELET